MHDSESVTSRFSGRTLCRVCGTPLQRCICDLITVVDSEVDVVIWQHPSEANHPKGTVNLLTRCLPSSQLLVAEQINQVDFFARLPGASKRWQLLFPDTQQLHAPKAVAFPASPASIGLLVLDGSWRKARRILYQNPWLQTLPRLSLASTLPSNYRIRKAEREGQLSTLEATCAAIEQIEGKRALCQPIREAFECSMARMERFLPPASD